MAMDRDMPYESESEDYTTSADSVVSADDAGEGTAAQPPEFYDAEADDRDDAWVQKMRRSGASDAILSCPLCFTTVCIDCQQHELYETQFRAMFVMNCKVKTKELVSFPQQQSKRQQKKLRRQQQAQQQAQQAQQQQQDAVLPDADRQLEPAAAADQQPQQQSQQQSQQQQGLEGRGAQRSVQQPAQEGQMHPVCCAVCDTEVGLREVSDGVFHFFNVFASTS